MPVLFFLTSLAARLRFALVALLAFMATGCASLTLADLQARNPQAYAGRICAFPREVPEGARIIAYQKNTQRIVSDADEMEIKLFAPAADVFLEYDPDAPSSSLDFLPASMGLSCPKRKPFFPASTVLFQEKQPPCPVAQAESDTLRPPRWLARLSDDVWGTERPDVRFLGQTSAPTRASWLQPLPGVAYPPNCETLIREAAKREASRVSEEIGKRFGRAIGDYQSSFNSVGVMDAKRRMRILRQDPLAFEMLQIDLAQKLSAIPELPSYDDPDVAQAALEGFESGYGAGMDEAKRQALAIDLAWAMAQSLCGNVACAVETAGIKALQLAVTRLRAMPLFIPGSTNGVGFFLKRLPQAAAQSSAQGTTAATTGAAAAEANTTETAVETLTRTKLDPKAVATNAVPSVAKTVAGVKEPSGQLHHAISERVYAALQKNDKLKGSFKLRDSQYTARAANQEAHNGYQDWHVALDKEIVGKIEAKEFLSAKDFAAWLYKRYKQPDLVKRFPNGLGANQ